VNTIIIEAKLKIILTIFANSITEIKSNERVKD